MTIPILKTTADDRIAELEKQLSEHILLASDYKQQAESHLTAWNETMDKLAKLQAEVHKTDVVCKMLFDIAASFTSKKEVWAKLDATIEKIEDKECTTK